MLRLLKESCSGPRCCCFAWLTVALTLLVVLPGKGQVIRGRVQEQITGQPLAGASVRLQGAQDTLGVATDSAGRFRFGQVLPGRYLLTVSSLGYAAYQVRDLLVSRGKEVTLEVVLTPVSHTLGEIEITTGEAVRGATTYPLANRGFSMEQTQRYAAAFYDPGRLLTSTPGITATDDGTNHLSVRGNSPAGVQWRLEGVHILNPNHQANAGTFSDRAAPAGGGVTVLSAQLLSQSRFLAGDYGPGYGNALGGIFDLRLRPGNNEQREHTVQASLIGMDLATEGPLSKKKKGSYLVNYRYSTVGLLSDLGVDFGNEAIHFQDLAYLLVLPAGKAGTFTLFGMGGLSSNRFRPPADSSLWEKAKDRYSISTASHLFTQGLTYQVRLGSRVQWRSAVGYSNARDKRQAASVASQLLPAENDLNEQELWSFQSQADYRLSTAITLQAGLLLDRHSAGLLSTRTGRLPRVTGQVTYQLWQPFVNASLQVTPELSAQAGLNFTYYTLAREHLAEPRAALTYRISETQSFSATAGLYSQVQTPTALLTALYPGRDSSLAQPNRYLLMSRSWRYGLGHTYQLLPDWKLHTEGYYQHQLRVPVSANPAGTYSVLNQLEEYVTIPLLNQGKGRNYGIEATLEKPLSHQYYLTLSGTLYQSEYQTAEARWRSTRFNGRYAFSLSAGREINWDRNGRHKTFGIHGRAFYRGGLREPEIDLAASAERETTVFRAEGVYARQLPVYYRVDLRLSLRTNRSRSNRTLALDIQNVTNRENVGYHYYDALLRNVTASRQLGLIPVISYRVEF